VAESKGEPSKGSTTNDKMNSLKATDIHIA